MIAEPLLKKYVAKLVRIRKNGIIFSAGEAASNFHIVNSGKVKMVTYSRDGSEFVQGYFISGRLVYKSITLPPFGSARNPIRMMEMEHQAAGDEMYAIRALSSTHTPPPDGCTTYRVTYQELGEFERDLHQHVHLENNVLFPAAIALEAKLFAATG